MIANTNAIAIPFQRALGTAFILVLMLAGVIGFLGTLPARVPTSGGASVAALGVAALLALLAFVLFRRRIGAAIAKLSDQLDRFSSITWLLMVITFGSLIRLVVFIAVPVAQTADKLAYWTMAQKFAAGAETVELETYVGTVRAFYPPGLGLALAPSVKLFGATPYTLFGFNLLLFIAICLAVYFLCRQLNLQNVGRFAVLLLAIWPNHIAAAPLATKELLLGLFLTLLLILTINAAQRDGWLSWRPVLAGILLGGAALTQPTMALAGLGVFVVDWMAGRSLLKAILRSAIVALVSIAVMAPWAIRNYDIFGAFIPGTTAGGLAIYLANNDRATGQFIPTEMYFPDYKEFPEHKWNEVGTRRALEWIRANPEKFILQIPRRQVAFMCCSDDNVFDLFWLGAKVRDWRYTASMSLGHAFWMLLLGLIIIGLFRTAALAYRSRAGRTDGDVLNNVFLLQTYLATFILIAFSFHSLVESGSRFGFTFAGFWAILAAISVCRLDGDGRLEKTMP